MARISRMTRIAKMVWMMTRIMVVPVPAVGAAVPAERERKGRPRIMNYRQG